MRHKRVVLSEDAGIVEQEIAIDENVVVNAESLANIDGVFWVEKEFARERSRRADDDTQSILT